MNTFDAQAFLDSAGVARKVVRYRRSATMFSQGDAGGSVLYIQKGGVRLSVVSKAGRQAIVAMLGPGDFPCCSPVTERRTSRRPSARSSHATPVASHGHEAIAPGGVPCQSLS